MKHKLGFRPTSMLCPKLIILGGAIMEDQKSFAELGITSEVSVVLIFSIDFSDRKIRKTVIDELRQLGPLVAGPAVAALSPDMPTDVREWAVGHLSSRAGQMLTPQAAAALATTLTHDCAHWIRHEAAEGLGQLGLAAKYLRELSDAATLDSNAGVRLAATKVLGRLGILAIPVAMELAYVLVEDINPDVRMEAAEALGSIGADVVPNGAMALIEAAAVDSDAGVRSRAAAELKKLSSTVAELDEVARVLEFARALEQSSEALAELGPVAVELAVEALIGASSGSADSRVREAVAAASLRLTRARGS